MQTPLDKNLQTQILRKLCAKPFRRHNVSKLCDHADLQPNLVYLCKLGLVDGFRANDRDRTFLDVKITVDGVDFIAPAAGVGSDLRVVTVKIDPNDLRTLIAGRIAKSEMAEKDKERLTHAIHSLSDRALGDLTGRLVNEAVDHLPGVLRLFQTFVSGL